MSEKLYVAYGSNLNLEQMAKRCPTAQVYRKGVIEDYRLRFNRVATIEPSKGDEVPVAVWIIDEECEDALDWYEGFPRLYRKETVTVTLDDGMQVEGMAYIMNYGEEQLPSLSYYMTIFHGYNDVGLDVKYLHEAQDRAADAAHTPIPLHKPTTK